MKKKIGECESCGSSDVELFQFKLTDQHIATYGSAEHVCAYCFGTSVNFEVLKNRVNHTIVQCFNLLEKRLKESK